MLGKIAVEIKGLCKLIQNRDTGVRVRIKDPTSPERREIEFKNAQYRNKKGLYQPSEQLEKCLEIAGRQEIFKGKQTYGKIIAGGIVIDPQEIPHQKGYKLSPFTTFVRIPPKTGGRVQKTRAILENWKLKFVITVMNDAINFDALKRIVTYAGGYLGLGDWRPKYGRFEVVKFSKV